VIIMRWGLERCVVRVEDETASLSCPLAVFDISSGANRDTATARLLVANFRTKFDDQNF
jgi:hypothetical protein